VQHFWHFSEVEWLYETDFVYYFLNLKLHYENYGDWNLFLFGTELSSNS